MLKVPRKAMVIIIFEFGKILRELRYSKQLTQTQLANDLGLAFSTISMYERGSRNPDFETLEAIADYFNVTIDYILGKDNRVNEAADTYSNFESKTNFLPLRQNFVAPFYDDDLVLTAKERKIIKAYREKPEMQSSILKLLDIENDKI